MAYGFTSDPLIYNPEGEAFHCSDFVERAGGWNNLDAATASLLSSLGCVPGELIPGEVPSDYPIEPVPEDQPFYTAPDVGGTDPAVTPAPGTFIPVETNVPLWAGPIASPQENKPVISTDPSFEDNPTSWLAPIVSSFAPVIGALQSTPQTNPITGALESIAKTLPQFFQNDIIQAGISSSQAPGRCSFKRRRLKIVTGTDGQPHVVMACPPRRMNPLNARALGRAARRLGAFHRIASHIEKLVQKACKSGSRRRSAPRIGCSPKRCR